MQKKGENSAKAHTYCLNIYLYKIRLKRSGMW